MRAGHRCPAQKVSHVSDAVADGRGQASPPRPTAANPTGTRPHGCSPPSSSITSSVRRTTRRLHPTVRHINQLHHQHRPRSLRRQTDAHPPQPRAPASVVVRLRRRRMERGHRNAGAQRQVRGPRPGRSPRPTPVRPPGPRPALRHRGKGGIDRRRPGGTARTQRSVLRRRLRPATAAGAAPAPRPATRPARGRSRRCGPGSIIRAPPAVAEREAG